MVLAVVDLPYAVTRRALGAGGVPDDDLTTVRRAVGLLLGAPG
ncbi:hypothetical protein ACQSSU_14145 [Micromonospora echinospora]